MKTLIIGMINIIIVMIPNREAGPLEETLWLPIPQVRSPPRTPSPIPTLYEHPSDSA